MNEFSKYCLGPIGELLPQEECLAVDTCKRKKFKIGVPKEIAFQENRVSLVPDGVMLIVANGHEVYVEHNAGINAHFTDADYANAGAIICADATEIYKCNIILKVAPLLLSEIDLLHNRQTIISSLHHTMQSKAYFTKLMQHKATAIAFEFIKDKNGVLPVVNTMSEISGYAAVQLAAEYLSKNDIGKGKLFGNISGVAPVELVIIGAGTVGYNATKAAIGFGANVKIFDNKTYKLRSLQRNINSQIFTSIINPKVLANALKSADVLICALHSEGRTPCIVTEEMVKDMSAGSVIIDVSIDHGGCVETSALTNHKEPVFVKYDVVHYCVPNIPSMVPQTASSTFSNFFTPEINILGNEGNLEHYFKKNLAMRQGIYMYNGYLTNRMIAESFGLQHKDLNLMLAAYDI